MEGGGGAGGGGGGGGGEELKHPTLPPHPLQNFTLLWAEPGFPSGVYCSLDW